MLDFISLCFSKILERITKKGIIFVKFVLIRWSNNCALKEWRLPTIPESKIQKSVNITFPILTLQAESIPSPKINSWYIVREGNTLSTNSCDEDSNNFYSLLMRNLLGNNEVDHLWIYCALSCFGTVNKWLLFYVIFLPEQDTCCLKNSSHNTEEQDAFKYID